MNRNLFARFSMALIDQAERDCAIQDPEMAEAAGMILVGDVYALLICRDDAPSRNVAIVEATARENGVRPFIR